MMLERNPNIKIVLSVEIPKWPEKETPIAMEKIVGHYLNRLGIPLHLNGYQYIKYGIVRCLKCPEELESVTKILYPNIAKRYHTSAAKVEHGIRHAIAKAWAEKQEEAWESLLGSFGKSGKVKPTNSQFIAAIADYIKQLDIAFNEVQKTQKPQYIENDRYLNVHLQKNGCYRFDR